jgi:uncharacterized protein YbjT (DUF2867 family)
MEVWLALPGSSIPTRGEENATLDRCYRFLQSFRHKTERLTEDHGKMLISGSPMLRSAFIAIHDVATLMIAAGDSDDARDRILDVGGPEVLTWQEVAENRAPGDTTIGALCRRCRR